MMQQNHTYLKWTEQKNVTVILNFAGDSEVDVFISPSDGISRVIFLGVSEQMLLQFLRKVLSRNITEGSIFSSTTHNTVIWYKLANKLISKHMNEFQTV
jgi:hypothetical protein